MPWKRREIAWGMKFVCVRAGLTQRTMNNQNGARGVGVLASGFVLVEDMCAGGMCKS